MRVTRFSPLARTFSGTFAQATTVWEGHTRWRRRPSRGYLRRCDTYLKSGRSEARTVLYGNMLYACSSVVLDFGCSTVFGVFGVKVGLLFSAKQGKGGASEKGHIFQTEVTHRCETPNAVFVQNEMRRAG